MDDDPIGQAPIRDYALISDCQGAALVGRSGTIDWACLSRFDSPALFARLLGAGAGHWSITPRAPFESERAYVRDTMVLRTTFHTAGGVVQLTDAMVFGAGEQGHHIGRTSPHVIVRRLDGIEGRVDVDLELAPRPEYGLTLPVFVTESRGARAVGGPRAVTFVSEVAVEVRGSDCVARVQVGAGDVVHFLLAVHSPWGEKPARLVDADPSTLLDDTIAAWRSWSSLHQAYEGPYADAVRHSGRVLQALTYAPTGAMVAAPTTSLPETLRGARNWDYRYCWVRDASMTLQALWVAACPDEAGDFFRFLATAAGGHLRTATDLQILYGVEGERFVPEHRLDHLGGYRDSRPVRVGNGAWDQVQLDVYGELLDAAALLATEVGSFDEMTTQFLVDVADAASARWPEADQGIWEMRGPPRHFLHSKLMCWVALDRAVRLAPMLGADARVPSWCAARDEVRRAIEEHGWNDAAGAFTQSFGSDSLDASALFVLITGFLPATDPRVRATVEAIASQLTDERGLVYRYRAPDGLEGEEGTFAICTLWLVECLAKLGEIARARDLLEAILAFGNDVGLLAEEIDAATGELLGNFPQAFTHIGVVNAAWAIACAEGYVDTTG